MRITNEQLRRVSGADTPCGCGALISTLTLDLRDARADAERLANALREIAKHGWCPCIPVKAALRAHDEEVKP